MATHRRSMSGLKVEESEKWGRQAARSRYGSLKYEDGAPMPKDTHGPQAPEDKHGASYANIHRDDWVRGAGESAEGKPGFDKSKR